MTLRTVVGRAQGLRWRQAPGTYYWHWLASYGAGGSNSGASHDCAAAGEVDTANRV